MRIAENFKAENLRELKAENVGELRVGIKN
jgi:hypothetical protein